MLANGVQLGYSGPEIHIVPKNLTLAQDAPEVYH